MVSRSATALSLQLPILVQRVPKFVRQRFRGRTCTSTAAFVVGCQRSGTNMLMRVLDRSPYTWMYDEANRSRAFDRYRLRDRKVIARLVERSGAKCVIFKPLCDSQWTDQLLDRHRGSRAIWAFRGFRDVAGSAVTKWGEHQQAVVRQVRAGDLAQVGWRGERIPSDLIEELRAIRESDLGPNAGAALKWYVRNRIYFDLKLDRSEAVRLVRYESLVDSASDAFPGLFDFLGLPYDELFVQDVFRSSVGRARSMSLPPAVEAMCQNLEDRLMRALERERTAGTQSRGSGPAKTLSPG